MDGWMSGVCGPLFLLVSLLLFSFLRLGWVWPFCWVSVSDPVVRLAVWRQYVRRTNWQETHKRALEFVC